MNLEVIPIINQDSNEVEYKIIDAVSGGIIGHIFTIFNNVAYEILPEYRGNGYATEALTIISGQLKRPVLAIHVENIASKKVAKKAGYKLVRIKKDLEMYQLEKSKKSV